MMLQETLLVMKNNLEKFNNENTLVTEEKINNIVTYFSNFKKGSFISPMKFISCTGIDIDKGYNILTCLEELRFIEPIFQVYCHECNNFQKEYYLTLVEIPDEELKESNIMVRYRVIKDQEYLQVNFIKLLEYEKRSLDLYINIDFDKIQNHELENEFSDVIANL